MRLVRFKSAFGTEYFTLCSVVREVKHKSLVKEGAIYVYFPKHSVRFNIPANNVFK